MKRFLIILAILTIAASASAAPPPFAIINPAQDSRIGTLTNTKWCYSDGSQIICTQDAPAGAGDFLANGTVPMTGAIIPDSAGGQTIGTTSAEWGHIYLHNSKSIYFQADQSLYLTGAAGALSLTGGNFVPGASTLTLGSTAAEWGGLYLGDGKIIYGQADQSNTITSSATGWVFNLPVTTQSAVLTGGTNTFNLTNGTASLDVAAGAALNIDTSLQVATGAVVLNGNAGGSSSLTLGNFALSLGGTMTDGRLCTYASSGTAISCNTATSTFQTADADLTAIAALTATRGDLMYVNSGGAWADLAIGSAGTVLQTNGADPSWALISADNITNDTITATQLAATLTFADQDFLDLSGITMSGTNDEGITLPFWADVTPTSGATKRFITWDESGGVLKIYTAGGWTTINPSAGAPTDVAYLVTGSLSGSLSAERLLTEGLAIDFTDAGANGNFTISFDPTELTGNRTWAAGGAAAVTWTWDNSGSTDPALTFGDGLISSNSTLLPATNDGAALGNTSYMWSDLFLASGSVINFNNGDVTLTHSENTLTLGGGNLALGANSITGTGSIGATGAGKLTKVWAVDIESTNAPSVNGVAANATNGLVTNPMTTAGDLITGAANGASTGRIAAVAAGQPLLSGGVGTASAYAGYTFSGTASQTYTFPGATTTLAGLGTAQTFTANNVFGDADTDTLTIRSLLVGGNSRAIWIAGSAPTPTYATGTNELYVGGDVEAGGNVYAANFVSTGTGESYIGMANNASRSPTASAYEIYFEGASDLKFNINGAEKTTARLEDAQTFSGAKTFTGGIYAGDASNAASVRLYDGSSNYWTIAVPAMSGNYTLTLPADDGTTGQYLKTDGSGALSWDTPTAAAAGSDTQVQFNDGGSALGGDAGFVFAKTTGTLTIGKNTVGGELVLYNELGATDYNATIQPNAAQAAAATITLPAATGTLIAEGLSTGGIVLGDSTPDADGEIGYASNAYTLFANSEDLSITAGTNLWTFASSTSATFAFTPSVAFTGGIGSIGAASNLSGGTVTLGALAGAIDAGGATSFEIPNGTGPTVDAAGEIAIDTTSDQLVYYGGAKRVLPYKQYASFVIPAPAATDDINLLKAPYGMTISAINCIVQGTTSVTGQLQECSSTGGDCTDLDSDITCDADGAADDGSLTDSTIASGGWLRWKTTSVSGTPTFLTVTVTYSVVSD